MGGSHMPSLEDVTGSIVVIGGLLGAVCQ